MNQNPLGKLGPSRRGQGVGPGVGRRRIEIGGISLPHIDFVRGLPKRHLAQRGQGGFLEEVLHGALSFVRAIDRTTLQSIEKCSRRQVDQDDLVRLLHHPIRDRLPHLNAGDLPHLIVEALQMLNVHGREHLDAGLEKRHHVFPPLASSRAGHIRVREFIDGADLGVPHENGVRIHLFAHVPAVLDAPPGDDL